MTKHSHLIGALAAGLSPLFRAIAKRLDAIEQRAAEPGPRGVDGLPGRDGAAGAPGIDGAPGLRGADGPHGPAGRDGRDGLPGPIGEKGVDGVNGADGSNGVNGLDGLGFDDLDVTYDGERALSLVFRQGERVKTFAFTLPIPIDRGVFRAGQLYARGDAVSWAGCSWIAQADTTDRPGDGATAWRMSTKAGRDGKAGPEGKPGKDGKDGAPGRDLTQIGPDGKKWGQA